MSPIMFLSLRQGGGSLWRSMIANPFYDIAERVIGGAAFVVAMDTGG